MIIEKTFELANVGCKSCHRSGSTHVNNYQEVKIQPRVTLDTVSPIKRKEYGSVKENMSLICHTHEKSPKFDYDRYLDRIRHTN